ncbi:MAG TPA: AI-2E family transporter [Candidatus Thermoplasmatota archaeon]|nr:AI-2E family transporter [Candidatus Thermoplasmatota archaeon]
MDRRAWAFLAATAAAFAFLGLVVVEPYAVYVLLGLIVGYFARGPARALGARTGWPRLSAGAVAVLIVTLVVLPLAVVVAVLADDAVAIARAVQDLGLDAYVAGELARFGLDEARSREAALALTSRLEGALADLAPSLLSVLASIGIGAFIFGLVTYYTSLQWESLRDLVLRVMPLPDGTKADLRREVRDVVRAVVLGNFAVGLTQGGAAGLAWWLAGYPQPLLATFFMVIVGMIPYVGPVIFLGPAAVWSIFTGDVLTGVVVLAYTLFIVGFVDNVTLLYVVGKAGKRLHPGLVFVGILGGLEAFGLAGFIVGPLILGLAAVLLEAVARERERRQNATPPTT